MPFSASRSVAASLSLMVAVVASGAVTGCGGAPASQARPPAYGQGAYPQGRQAFAGLPSIPGGWAVNQSGLPVIPSSWAANAAAAGSSLSAYMQALPCPVPGLPPEVARLVDCSAMRKIAGAARYVPTKVVEGALPVAVDLRQTGLTGPIKNQEQVGACAGFALSTVMDNSARRLGRSDTVAPLHVFSTYGGSGKGLETVKGRGMTLEPTWPYDPKRACEFADDWTGQGCGEYYGVSQGNAVNDPRLMGEKARADATAHYRVDGFEEMDPVDPGQLAVLVAGGETVWIAMQFDRDAWSHAAVRDGFLRDYSPTYPVGHAVVVSGYRRGAREREFLLQNSWGTGWGDHGDVWIEESVLKRRANYAYRIRVSDAPGAPNLGGGGQLPSPGAWAVPSCGQGGVATPFGCIDPRTLGGGALPALPGLSSITQLPGFPQIQNLPAPPALAGCPAGTLPNILAGGCVRLQ